MTAVDEPAAGHRRQPRINLLRRGAIGAAVALAGLTAAIGPASAVASTDGTSNTTQLAVTSAVLDQAYHRVVVTAPAAGDLAGRHLAAVEVVTPRLTYTLNNTMVSGLVGASPESVSISFAEIKVDASGSAACVSGVDACLMESDGIWLPGG
jgi:hypothetical protein